LSGHFQDFLGDARAAFGYRNVGDAWCRPARPAESVMANRNGDKARGRTAAACAYAVLLVAFAATGCVDLPAVLTQRVEARRLESELRVQFARAAEASNRAVMEESDEASSAAARDAKRARESVVRDVGALRELLQSLAYDGDLKLLDAFAARFAEYERLDDEILPLAVENTNLKAQRLAFGPARAAAEEFRAGIDAAARTAPRSQANAAALLAARAHAAVLELRVLQTPHIAESAEREMTGIEEEMAARGGEARQNLDRLEAALPPTAAAPLASASAALERFLALNAEIVALSRRNTNVRSLALALGRKRVVTAECEEHLQAMAQAIARHEFSATR
jgi:hypothetical protein